MGPRSTVLWFGVAGATIVACAAALSIASGRFGYDHAVADMPILPMVACLMLAGVAFSGAAFFLYRLVQYEPDGMRTRTILVLIVAIGALARLALAFSEPILEDDYQRYLWDGAVTSAGYNPYSVLPESASVSTDPALAALAHAAGLTLERVNHPEIRTIYPPGAQAFFALAHQIKPFSLDAWRAVVMFADVATFGLILLLLQIAGCSPLWSALYWWNPIVIKELTNSVHMEAVLMPFVLAAVWYAVRRRPVAASIAIALAGAIKIWPLALFPVLMRGATERMIIWAGCAVLVGAATVLWAMPMIVAGLDQSAGVVAYAERWRTNSAGFAALLWLADQSGLPSLLALTPNHIARGTIALFIIAAGLAAAWAAMPRDPETVIRRAGLVAIAVFLVSPAQFPWYVVWIAPFLPFLPLPGLIFLAITMPLYYVAFHLMSIDAFPLFNSIVIWCVWCPVWALLIMQWVLQGPIERGHAAAALTRQRG